MYKTLEAFTMKAKYDTIQYTHLRTRNERESTKGR